MIEWVISAFCYVKVLLTGMSKKSHGTDDNSDVALYSAKVLPMI